MWRMSVLGLCRVEVGVLVVGGWGQGKLKIEDVGREEGLEFWSMGWVLRGQGLVLAMLRDFSGSG